MLSKEKMNTEIPLSFQSINTIMAERGGTNAVWKKLEICFGYKQGWIRIASGRRILQKGM